MKVHGVSLHYFNDTENSDKYYRVFIWPYEDSTGRWRVAYHWGRDGSPRGQVKEETYFAQRDAVDAVERRVHLKLDKGYEFLGRGDIEVPDMHTLSDIHHTGTLLHERVGRQPTKIFGGFSLIIREEDYIEDLI
jgi:predicted DNA-binding WGR domain protein